MTLQIIDVTDGKVSLREIVKAINATIKHIKKQEISLSDKFSDLEYHIEENKQRLDSLHTITKGDPGQDGINGIDGQDGQDGKDGVGGKTV